MLSGVIVAGYLFRQVKRQYAQYQKGSPVEEPIMSCGPYGSRRAFSGILTNNDARDSMIKIDEEMQNVARADAGKEFEFGQPESIIMSSEGLEEYNINQDFASMGIDEIQNAQQAECKLRDNLPKLTPRYQNQSPRYANTSTRERLI